MDKKQKRKWIPAVCFVVICGVVCLWIRYGDRNERQIVMEKSADPEGVFVTEKVSEATTVAEQNNEAEEDAFTEIYVHVCGAVVTEGVYALPSGCRVADGIEAAGGFSENADKVYHNLASLLSDGQKVYVPTLEETKELSAGERLMRDETEPFGQTASHGGSGTGKVNLNTADCRTLMTLEGIGEAKAKRILEYREKVGVFQSIEEIKNVSGIGDAMFERIKEDIVAE